MFIEYFNKFRNMKPYLLIEKEEWDYIKNNFDREDVK